MRPRRRKGTWYLPGRLYDLAFGTMFRGLRRRVAGAVEADRLYPWLDVCCGTGDQFRRISGRSGRQGGRTEERGECDQRSRGANGEAVYGLDKSLGHVRYAATRAPEVPFVCGDAVRLPFKDGSMRAVSVSFGLHDKSQEVRCAILAEVRRVLASGGRLIAVDFEKPWNPRARIGAILVALVERFARGDHFRNGREFLERGGLTVHLRENGFAEVSRFDIEAGSLGLVVAAPRRSP